MTYKDNMLKLTHKFHKKDEWVKAFIDCVQAKINDGILFCPMQHPSRISYKKIAEDLNYFFDLYFDNTRRAK